MSNLKYQVNERTMPQIDISNKYFYKLLDNGYVSFFRINQNELGENRSLRIDEFGAIASVNDSILICSSIDEPNFIKKVKFNYDDLTYEVLEDYPISISEITYPSGNTSETDISRLVVNDNYIAYANYIENTIRIIEDNDLVTTVETYETIDYDEFNQMLESGLYEVNVYDLNGRELFNETSSNFSIEKLKRNRPYLINIYNDNTSKVFKLIR
jgi:hypothetical protein